MGPVRDLWYLGFQKIKTSKCFEKKPWRGQSKLKTDSDKRTKMAWEIPENIFACFTNDQMFPFLEWLSESELSSTL